MSQTFTFWSRGERYDAKPDGTVRRHEAMTFSSLQIAVVKGRLRPTLVVHFMIVFGVVISLPYLLRGQATAPAPTPPRRLPPRQGEPFTA